MGCIADPCTFQVLLLKNHHQQGGQTRKTKINQDINFLIFPNKSTISQQRKINQENNMQENAINITDENVLVSG